MMVLVVLMIFVLAGMIALILDGGAIMSNRRTAQAAADAGALAGAQRVCYGYTDGESVAEYYAINKNGASSAEVSITGYSVTVQATVENESFFAKIFGVDTLTSVAEATSGCYGPRGKSVVPLAWNCRAPSVGEPGPYPEEYGCEVQTLDWQEVLRPLVEGEVATQDISDYDDNVQTYEMNGFNVVNSAGVPPEQIYIIYDSDKICVEDDPVSGALQCDLDGDGKKDIQIGGDRGWLYLTADTSSIGDWVDDGPHPDILLQSHIWLSGKSGVDTSVIIKMANNGFAGEVVLIPVYNVICEGDPRDDASCVAEAHATPPWPPFFGEDNMDEIRNGTLNYHILTFEPFYITCVSKSGDCPGFRYAQTLPKGEELKDGPVIEGFFLSNVGVTPDTSQGCDINLGNCVISLSN
jgi:hypothetical protein